MAKHKPNGNPFGRELTVWGIERQLAEITHSGTGNYMMFLSHVGLGGATVESCIRSRFFCMEAKYRHIAIEIVCRSVDEMFSAYSTVMPHFSAEVSEKTLHDEQVAYANRCRQTLLCFEERFLVLGGALEVEATLFAMQDNLDAMSKPRKRRVKFCDYIHEQKGYRWMASTLFGCGKSVEAIETQILRCWKQYSKLHLLEWVQ